MTPHNVRRQAVVLSAAGVLAGSLGRPVQAQDACGVGYFQAQYFNNQGKRVFTRCERPRIRHDWRDGGAVKGGITDEKGDAPASLKVGPDHFRVTWAGRFHFQDGTYTFIAEADDGIRVTVDGETLIDEWRIQPATVFRKQRRMTNGLHNVEVEYFEETDAASVKFYWER